MYRTFSLFKHLVFVVAFASQAHAASLTLPLFVSRANAQTEVAKKSTPIPFAKSKEDQARAAKSNSDVKTAASQKPAAGALPETVQVDSAMRSVNKKDTAALKTLNEKYRKAKSITMDVSKNLKLGMVGSERKSAGKLEMAKGQLRMELEGSEHTLLVVNKKNVFAVTYPDKSLQGAAIQVIKGDVTKKQKKQNALAGLLGPGGFLKSFKPTGVQQNASDVTYFLSPIGDSDMTRAQLKVANGEIRELHFWDSRDNETTFSFNNTNFGAKVDPSRFNYTPPANADVMNL